MSKILFYLAIAMSVFNQNCQNSTSDKQDKTATSTPSVDETKMGKICGLSFVAPPKPFRGAPMMEVKAVNADWIAVIPYAYTRLNEAKVHYQKSGWGWWGERPEGAQTTIDSAHKAGLKVMLKPQVYIPGGWTGGLDFKTDAEWASWEHDYETYIMTFVEMAHLMQTDMLCIGTEFKIGAVKREAFWRNLIKKVREKYKGKLIYSANWDEYASVPFWDVLDGVGINAYFPLVQKDTPSVEELKTAWQPICQQIRDFHNKIKKPIVFTEYGYLSVDGCAFNSWDVEKRVHQCNINQQAQANAIDALFEIFWKEPWWQGGFIWKWFPEGEGHEGYPERDYTPQGKLAENVLRKWHSKR